MVLIIVSECESQPGPEVVLRRPACELTEEWREKLENQGIAREHQDNDLSIIKARYARDSNYYTIRGVEMSSDGLTRDRVLKKIKTLMNNCDKKQGIGLYYIGAGRKGTGDWCFEDGFITFRDIMDLYMEIIRGCVLAIMSDCSHSGSWVRECMAFLDEQGVKPCGHSARDKEILVVLSTSCLSHQVPRQLAYSVHGSQNDKNTGMCIVNGTPDFTPFPIIDSQHSVSENFTMIRCDAKDIGVKCQCVPGANWKAWSVFNRVITLIDEKENKWILFLVVDDDETIAQLMDTQFANYQCYGEVLKIGEGKGPTKEELQVATEKYAVYHKV